MIHVLGSSSPVSGYTPDESAEASGLASPVANSAPAGEPAALPAPIPSGDPLAKFGGLYGLHAGVQQMVWGWGGGFGGTKSPPPVYDVATTPQKEIDDLKKSGDAAQRRLGHTIENARASYGDLLAKGARIVVTTSQGNGGQPVMTLMGPGFDPNDPNKTARVHTHYHGDNATVADPIGSKAGTNSRIREVIARDPQTVFVLPEAGNSPQGVDSPQNDKYYPASWANVQSQVQTTEDALKAAGVSKVGKEIVSVHSRGGEVLQRLMALDGTGGLLRANRLEMYDSLYGSQDSVAKWGRTANGKAAESVIYFHGTNKAGRHAVIENAFAGKFKKVDMKDQKPLDDTVNPVYHDANNKTYTRTKEWTDKDGTKHVSHPVVRQFDSNAHYRTTGQFLDSEPGP